jgi:hypothetical protein
MNDTPAPTPDTPEQCRQDEFLMNEAQFDTADPTPDAPDVEAAFSWVCDHTAPPLYMETGDYDYKQHIDKRGLALATLRTTLAQRDAEIVRLRDENDRLVLIRDEYNRQLAQAERERDAYKWIAFSGHARNACDCPECIAAREATSE